MKYLLFILNILCALLLIFTTVRAWGSADFAFTQSQYALRQLRSEFCYKMISGTISKVDCKYSDQELLNLYEQNKEVYDHIGKTLSFILTFLLVGIIQLMLSWFIIRNNHLGIYLSLTLLIISSAALFWRGILFFPIYLLLPLLFLVDLVFFITIRHNKKLVN